MHSNNNIKNMHQSANEYSLFVGDLPHDCSDDKLQRLFQSKFKSVKRVQIIRNNEDGTSRGFGFIRFEDRADFQTALSQEMKIGNNTLRLDMAHRHYKNNNRNRYNSFNSTGSNNSNHHHHHFNNNNNNNLHHQPHYQHHHHNQPHHQHHHHQPQHAQQSQQQHGSQPHHANHQNNNNNNKPLIAEVQMANAGDHQQALSSNARTSGNSQQQSVASSSNSPSGQQALAHQQHRHALHNSLPNQGQFDPQQQQKNSSQNHQAPPDSKNTKQTNLSLGGDDVSQSQNQNQLQAQQQQMQPHPPQQPLPQTQLQHNLPPAPLSSLGNGNNLTVAMPNQSIVATTSATTTLSSSNMNHTTNAVLSNHNINTSHQQAIGPDLRGYMPPTMDGQHLMGAEQASMMPQTSVYSYVYPYGPPPPFGYMHPPPPQPNPVIPISAVPPAPPNQASPSSGLSQQHTLTASNATRLNETQHLHQPQPPHATTADASAIAGTMPGGVQAPHQGPQFYYYYPSPLYFDQAGAAAPPNMYHPQSFHPQFFAMPNPAYMPNAHQQQQPTYNQHQPQPPTASQSDAPVMGQPQPQPHQPQVNLRTRDIDTTIE